VNSHHRQWFIQTHRSRNVNSSTILQKIIANHCCQRLDGVLSIYSGSAHMTTGRLMLLKVHYMQQVSHSTGVFAVTSFLFSDYWCRLQVGEQGWTSHSTHCRDKSSGNQLHCTALTDKYTNRVT